MRHGDSVAKIAVVDDDEAVRQAISSLLQSAGYQCKVYASAELFIGVCAWQQADCAIVDFRLPGLNGLELQRMLNEKRHSVPIIMVSAYDDRVRAEALEQGAVAVLGKPFDGEALLAAVRSALGPSGRE
jgi:FixJ family two-component response regulator